MLSDKLLPKETTLKWTSVKSKPFCKAENLSSLLSFLKLDFFLT